jgi:hypothetical protein
MKFLNNINAKRKLKNMNNSLNKVFLSTNKDEFHSNLEHAIKIHNDAEHDLDDSYLFPENDEEKQIFSKNVWLNIDTIKFLSNYSSNVIADTLINSIGSFYIHKDRHTRMLFANFILDGLIMAQGFYKNNWKEYISRYFEIQSHVTQFVEKQVLADSWTIKNDHPFNYQYPSYYLFTALKEEIENTEKVTLTHYDRALVKLAILHKNNPIKAKEYIQMAIDIYGASVVLNGEEKYFISPMNAMLYDDDTDRLKDYSFITNTIESLNSHNLEDMLG